METVSHNATETAAIAQDFLAKLKTGPKGSSAATVVGLYGELGSGKTTFMQALAKTLEVKEVIQSPTFVIMKYFTVPHHPDFDKLVHIDAYRIEQPVEMLTLGLPELLLRPKTLICIEWPEKISELLSPEHWRIEFRHGQNENERIIKLPW